MVQSTGTPTTLRTAVENGLTQARVETSKPSGKVVTDHIQDFLAQKFTAAFMRAHDSPAVLRAIEKLMDEVGVEMGGRRRAG